MPNKKVDIREDYESDSGNATYLDIVTHKGFDPEKVTLDNFQDQNISFELYLNIRRIRSFYRQLNLGGKLSFEEFKFAFLVKELSTIRCGAVEYLHLVDAGMPYAKNQVWEYIFGLLETRRSRYRLSGEIPACSRFFAIYNACVRKTVTMEMVHRDMERFQHVLPEFERVRDMLEDLYNLVIHNRFREGSGVAEYALPFVLAAERQEVLTSAEAAKAIYNYILLPNDLHKMFSFRFMDMVMEYDELFEDTLLEERPEITPDEAKGFYREVLLDRMDEIARVRNVFKRIFTMTEEVEVFDGDVNLKRQQQLYLDSITGDSGRNYLQRRFKNTTLDVVLLRDVSFSTDLSRREYAEAIVTILAALEGIPAVRTAQIDFSDFPKVNKFFDKPLSDSTIAPEAFGATFMAGALEIVDSFPLRADKRIAFVITDGEIEDRESCLEWMEKLEKVKGFVFSMIGITANVYGDFLEVEGKNARCSYSMLDKALFQILLKELI